MLLLRLSFPGVARLFPDSPGSSEPLGFHFGRAAMRFVKVAGLSRSLTAFFRTASDSGACQCGARYLSGVAGLFGNSPGSSELLGFQSGRAVTCWVEVAAVSTRLTSFFPTASDSGA